MQREKIEQAHIVQLAKTLQAEVYVFGTRRSRGKNCPKCGTFVAEHQGTRQTPGPADLLIFLRKADTEVALFWEAKAPGVKLKDADQLKFKAHVERAGIAHGHGDFDAFIAWLIEHDYLKRDSVPHYRQPAVAGGPEVS